MRNCGWWWTTAPSTSSLWWTSIPLPASTRCLIELEMRLTSPNSGFHQIRVFPDHVERTAFRTKYGTFAYQVMPFGLCNAPATFQRTMDFIFQNMRAFAGAYIDDILVYTKTLEEHLVALRQVYDRLRLERFFAGPEKCSWPSPRSNTVASFSAHRAFDRSRKSYWPSDTGHPPKASPKCAASLAFAGSTNVLWWTTHRSRRR